MPTRRELLASHLEAARRIMPVELFRREYGDGGAPPVLLLHGLFGSSANWQRIARRIAGARRVLVPDLRNHGRSPKCSSMSYAEMAEDLSALLDAESIREATLVGHSMGGKVAMWLALSQPERVSALVVADIAPVTYGHRFDTILDALTGLDLAHIADRRQADALLAEHIPAPAVRGYLLHSLVREGDLWRWRFNLQALVDSMDVIREFPQSGGHQYPGHVLFVYGADSDYLSGGHLPTIRRLFPLARLRAIPGAGHWVYADQPDAFARALESFLRV